MDNQTSDTVSTDTVPDIPHPADVRRAEQALAGLPERAPGETLPFYGAPLSPSAAVSVGAAGFDPVIAQAALSLPEVPPNYMEELPDPSDFVMLNRRIDDLQSQLAAMNADHEKALQYLCHNMGWLVNMLSGVAQLAQNMPGMGGVAKMMLRGGK